MAEPKKRPARSELSRQLDRLAERQRGSKVKVHGLRSFLFDAQEAQQHDIDAVYLLGTNGLTELADIDARFAAFRATLFAPELRGVEPESRTEAALRATDADIARLCALLCAHFARRAAHKVVEWLVRNFKAYERPRCVDALLACALPYHETAAFARLLPVLSLTGRWEFLRPLARAGLPLARDALAEQCRTDPALLRWIADAAVRARAEGALARQFAALVAALAASLLTGPHSRGAAGVVGALLPLVTELLAPPCTDAAACTLACTVLAQIAAATPLAPAAAKSALELLVGAFASATESAEQSGELQQTLALTAAHLCASAVRPLRLGPSALPGLLDTASQWSSVLASSASAFDVSAICTVLLKALLTLGLAAEVDDASKRASAWAGIRGLLGAVRMSPAAAGAFASKLLSHFKTIGGAIISEQEEEDDDDDTMRDEGEGGEGKLLRVVLAELATRYPSELDGAIGKSLQQSGAGGNWLLGVLRTTFEGTVHQPLPEGFVLAAAVRHPEAAARISALRKLDELAQGSPSKEVADLARQAVLERLSPDEDDDVLVQLLSMRWALDTVAPEELLPRALSVLARTKPRTLGLAATKLCLSAIASRDPSLAPSLLEVCWPRLTIAKATARTDRLFADTCASLDLLPLCAGMPHFAVDDAEEAAHIGEAQRLQMRTDIHAAIAANVASDAGLVPQVAQLSRISNRALVVSLNVLLAALRCAPEGTRLPIAHALTSLVLPSLRSEEGAGLTEPPPEGDALANLAALADVRDPVLAPVLGLQILQAALEAAAISPFTEPTRTRETEAALLRAVFFGTATLKLGAAKQLLSLILALFPQGDRLAAFLAHFWTHPEATSCARIRALNFASLLLCSHREEDVTAEVQELAPALVVPLQSEVRPVRNAALALLVEIASSSVRENSRYLTSVANALLAAKVELHAEPSFIQGVCEQLRTHGSFSGTAISGQAITDFGKQLAQLAIAPEQCSSVRHMLLVPAAALSPAETLRIALPLLGQPLKKLGRSTAELLLSLHSPDASAAFEVANPVAVLDPFLACLSISGPGAPAHPLCLSALRRVTPELWTSLPASCHMPLLSRMLSITALCGGVEERTAAVDALRALDLSDKLLTPFLELPTQLPPTAMAITGAALELLVDRCEQLDGLVKPLVPAVFQIVRALVDPAHEASHAPAREYTLQLAVSALAHITEAIVRARREGKSLDGAENEGEKAPQTPARMGVPKVACARKVKQAKGAEAAREVALLEQAFDVELITQCLRTVNSPQVHLHALTLLASAASLVPGLVLRHAVEVLSLVAGSASTVGIQQDDPATLDVLRRAIAGIVPPMLQQPGSNGGAPVVFALVEGFQRIPRHRRLPLFTTVVEMIGVKRLGHVLLALLSREARQQQDETSDFDESDTHAFCRKLCLAFSPAVAVSAMSGLVRLPLTGISGEWKAFLGSFGPEHAQTVSMRFVASHIGSREFVQSLIEPSVADDDEDDEEEDVQQPKAQAELLALFEDAARVLAQAQQIHAALLDAVRGVLSSVKGVLTVPAFVGAVARLLGSSSEAARREGLVLLNEKLEGIAPSMTDSEAALFTDSSPESITGLVCTMLEPKEPATARQTALLTLEILARALAHGRPDAFVSLLGRAVDALADPDESVSSSALLCVATFVSEIGPLSVPHLPRFMPVLLERLEGSFERSGAQSALSALRVIVRHIARFLSPYAPRMVSLLLRPELSSTASSEVLKALTEGVEPRVMLDPLFTAFSDAAPASLPRLLDVVRDVTARMQPAAVAAQHIRLFRFYLDGAFALRSRDGITVAEADDAEYHAVSAFVQLVLKLSESLFKPLFLKLHDHFEHKSARQGDEPLGDDERAAATLYCNILHSLAERLRGLFVPYCGHFGEYLVSHLRGRDSAALVKQLLEEDDDDDDDDDEEQDEEDEDTPRKRTRSESDLEKTQEGEARLAEVALDTLRLCLLHDTQGYADSAFSLLVEAAGQVDNWALGEERHAQLMRTSLLPFVAALAGAVTRDKVARWKNLNHRLLLQTRDEHAEVRRWALAAITEIWRRAGEDIVAVLPDTVPYLSELLQDSDAEVEAAANVLAEVIQSFLGEESLRDYL